MFNNKCIVFKVCSLGHPGVHVWDNGKFKTISFGFGYAPIGHIGNVGVYKAVNGYYLVDECDNSKFKFIK